MPTYQTETAFPQEPKSRFYPPQGMRPVPAPSQKPPVFPARKKEDDAAYFAHRHPVSLQRLYEAADSLLSAYPRHSFIYDDYPDYLSLHLMRDRLLRENPSLTEEFLQAGCPIHWLNLLTDTVLSEQLCKLRRSYRSPKGDASTTSVRFMSRS